MLSALGFTYVGVYHTDGIDIKSTVMLGSAQFSIAGLLMLSAIYSLKKTKNSGMVLSLGWAAFLSFTVYVLS